MKKVLIITSLCLFVSCGLIPEPDHIQYSRSFTERPEGWPQAPEIVDDSITNCISQCAYTVLSSYFAQEAFKNDTTVIKDFCLRECVNSLTSPEADIVGFIKTYRDRVPAEKFREFF